MDYDRRRNNDLTSLRAEKDDKSKSEKTFEVKITSAFTVMRDDLERTTRETNTYADKILGLLGQLEDLHLRKNAGCHIIKEHPNKEKFENLLSTYSSLLNELAPWRTQVIQAGEEATRVQSARMRKSRMDIMNAAKRRLDEGREKQQLATDASELMRHYKALVMAA
ncbi:hypothetical protein HD554DRAFT_180687 [Boletus coccyginus]|nr:hypothetical protein HD554DRAFT_180687 [Boletus coccyginus]